MNAIDYLPGVNMDGIGEKEIGDAVKTLEENYSNDETHPVAGAAKPTTKSVTAQTAPQPYGYPDSVERSPYTRRGDDTLTRFGSKVRVVNQKTGMVSWEDANGNKIATPDSEVKRSKFGSWDDALKDQEAEKYAELRQRITSLNAPDEEAKAQKRRGMDAYNEAVAKSFATATANMNQNVSAVQKSLNENGKVTEGNGLNGTVYRNSDGRCYVRGIVSEKALGIGSAEAANAGSSNILKMVVVSQEVSPDGKPMPGVGPTYSLVGVKDGAISDKGAGTYHKTYSSAQAMKVVEDSLVRMGYSREMSKKFMHDSFGGEYDDVLKYGSTSEKGGNWHESVARTNAASREKIAGINAASREKIAGMNNENRLDVANLNASSKKELSDAANVLKKYGIDVGLKIATDKNDSAERIASQREAGRQARAVMRDNQAWEKLAIEQDKVDKTFSVQMKKADTYGKRVDLIEKKIANDYEVAMKNAGTAEERNAIEAEYKDRMASVAEGNIDLNWFKANTDIEQKEKDRQNKLELAELNAKQERGMKLTKDELDRKLKLQKLRNGGGLTTETRKAVEAELNGNKAPIKTGDNSGDENIPGYAPEQIAELKKRGYSWNGSRWVK